MPHPRTILALTILLSLITATPHAHAENIVFPPDAGVVDVTQPPYRATPDDDTDDTAAIQRALDDHPSGNAIIYLPNGTYRVTDTLRWPDGPRGGLEQKRVILQGQSRDGAILRVPDNHANFNDPAKPRAVIWTGRKPAQRFRNAIRNLTVDTGSGNGGAIGVQFIANNQGCVRRVHIRSGNGAGLIGLDMAHTDEIGPLLVKHLRVTGFNIGIKTYWPVNSVTFEHITLENQNKIGWENYGQKVYVRGLTSRNAVPVLLNKKDGWSGVVLLDADLRGEGDAADKPAIINNKGMAVRDIRTTGYKMAIRHWDKGRGNQPGVDGPNVDDWQSHDSPTRLFDAPATPTPRQ